jgi:hypothetical protein
MPPAAQGALIDRVRRSSGDAMAQNVATAMRERMLAQKPTSDGPARGAKSLDDKVKGFLGVSDKLDPQASQLRRSFNEQASKVLGALEALGRVKDLYDNAMLTKTVVTEMQKLVDPSLSPEERKKVEDGLKSTWWELVKSQGFSQILARSPTVAAMFGTWSLAFDGTGFLLENMRPGKGSVPRSSKLPSTLPTGMFAMPARPLTTCASISVRRRNAADRPNRIRNCWTVTCARSRRGACDSARAARL